MFQRYTEKARRSIFFARYEASRFGSPCIESEHLLLGLMREVKSSLDIFLPDLEKRAAIPRRIEEHCIIREKIAAAVDLPLSKECKRALVYAAEEADRLQHSHIGTEHLLLGVLREDGCFAAQLMRESGADIERARKTLAEMAARPDPNSESTGSETASPRYEMARELFEEAQQLLMSPANYSEAAWKGLLFARHEAARSGSLPIESRHMLFGLLHQTRGDLYRFLPASISAESIRTKAKTTDMMDVPASQPLSLEFSDECKQAMAFAEEEAARLQHSKIAVEHLLLGLLRIENSVASKIMREGGANLDQLRRKLADAAPPQTGARS